MNAMNGNDWLVPAVVVLLASSVAAFTDAWRFKVHNLLTFPLALSGIMFHTSTGGTQGFLFAAAGLASGLAILLIPYCVGGLGAGDVKFFAAVSAWLGTGPMVTILVIACIGTGVFSAVVIARQGGLRAIWRSLRSACESLLIWRYAGAPARTSVQEVLAKSPDYRRRLVPFTAMMAVGVLAVVVRQVVWSV